MTALVEARAIAIPGRLEPCDLAIAAGQAVAVIGPNGGGKTSLLRALARTEDALGEVRIERRDIDQLGEAHRRKLLSFLPALRDAAWPIAVADFIAFGLAVPDPARITALLDVLELMKLAGRPLDRLSTGERARAMLARAIAGRASFLLLDEPLSNLDPYWVLRTLDLLLAEQASNGGAMLLSVHDLSLIERFERVLLVDGGRIVGDGAPSAVLASAQFAAAFRIERLGSGWAIRPAGRRSSP